jgi:protein-disulfide isomerase
MDKRFLGILGTIIIIFIAVFAITQSSNKSPNNSSSTSGASATNHVEGGGAKNVTLQEWGDYECPICEQYYLPLKQAVAQLMPDIHFQFSNLPLIAVHQNAFAGARAAEAAGLQDKYWQMHDKLYDNQNDWASASNPETFFDTYARQIGLNLTKFKQDYSSSKVNDAINADISAFLDTPYVNHDTKKEATPTFFLDGKNIPNTVFLDSQTQAPSATQIVNVLNAEIAKKNPSSKQ